MARELRDNVPTFNEILETFAPLYAFSILALAGLLILQLRYRLPHYVREQIDQSRSGLHLGAVCGERKAVLRHFQEGDAQGPDVRGYGIGLTGYSFGGHVVGGTDEGVGITFSPELARHAKVTQTDEATASEEDVRRFDVYVQGQSSVNTGLSCRYEIARFCIPLCMILRPCR